MTRIKQVIQNKKGNSYPLAIAIALAIVIISCGAYEYICYFSRKKEGEGKRETEINKGK